MVTAAGSQAIGGWKKVVTYNGCRNDADVRRLEVEVEMAGMGEVGGGKDGRWIEKTACQ